MSTSNETRFTQILAAVESCSTDVVHYLPSRTDDGSTGDDGTLNAQTDGGQLEDHGPTENEIDDKGWRTGRMHNVQMVRSKNRSLVYQSIVT